MTGTKSQAEPLLGGDIMLIFGTNFNLAEIMTSTRSRTEQFLVRWAIPQLHDIDALSRMVDPSLEGEYPPKSLSHFADIISRCVQVSALR